MKIKNFEQEIKAWIIVESRTKAKTEKGIERAVAKFKKLVPDYLSVYFSELEHSAISEMAYEARRKADNLFGDALKAKAYKVLFANTRLRKIYKGTNVGLGIGARINTETNGKGGWDKVVRHYACYAAEVYLNRLRYDIGNGEKSSIITKNGTAKIEGEIILQKQEKKENILNTRTLRRIYSSQIRGNGIIWRWDKDEGGMYIHLRSGEIYHTPSYADFDAFKKAVTAFRKRRNEKRYKENKEKAKQILATRPVYVTVQDSLKSGNCESMTLRFLREIQEDTEIGSEDAISAEYILARRWDMYTERACIHAAMKFI